MNIAKLKNELNEMHVPARFYSINDSLKTDAYILNCVYGQWEYFYFDEKGERLEEKKFENEEAAAEFFLTKIKNEMKYMPRF